ncbi:MAG: outer membrane beta-barrel protein [Elusimicrobia bacterium]|nr:outer membrane beta-barrel protein [Elusimicrobiota bacterium]
MKHILVAVFMLAAAQPALAQAQNIKLYGVEINPVVSMKQSYDSNIYLKPVTRTSSNINRTAFGLNAKKQFGARLDLNGGYQLELLTYSRAGGINDAVHHSVNVAAGAKLPRNTALTVKEDFTHTTDQATSELTARAQRLQNTFAASVESPLRGKFGYGVNMQHTYHNYDLRANDALDRAEFLAGFDINYQWQPKTKLFFSYTYGVLNYAYNNTTTNTKANDSTYNNVDVGATGNLAPKLEGTVKAGLQLRNYDRNLATARNSSTTGGYSAQLVWKALEKTQVVLFAKRGNIEATAGNSRYYTSTLTDLSASREVRKVKVGAGVSFETLNYPERTVTGGVAGPKRFDHNTTLKLTAAYNIQKWLKADFGYSYKNRSSNEGDNKYKVNVIGIGLTGMF